jgi:hypothetical protein
MTRRGFLKWLGGLALSGAALTGYAFAIEPGFRLRIQRYAFTPPNWTPGLKLKVVCLADPHLGEPYMPVSRWRKSSIPPTGWNRTCFCCWATTPEATGSSRGA